MTEGDLTPRPPLQSGERGETRKAQGQPSLGFRLSPRVVLGSLLVLALVAVIALSPDAATVWRYAKGQLDTWKAWVHDHFALAVLAYLVAYILILTPPIPLAAVTATGAASRRKLKMLMSCGARFQRAFTSARTTPRFRRWA